MAELEIDHVHVPLGGRFGGLSTAEFLVMNPAGTIPVIDDGGIVVRESLAILPYLAATRGGEAFWPADPSRRAAMDPWIEWTQTRLQPDFINGVFWGFYRTPESQRDEAAVREAIERTGQNFALLDRLLAKQPYVSGPELGLADIPTGVAVG